MKIEKIYYWPKWFKETLPKNEQAKLKPKLLTALGQGQIYLWRALNIYDDFLDGAGEREKLPLANSYFRHYLEIYYRLDLPPDFYDLFEKVLSDLDRTNERETQEMKLKTKNSRLIIPKKLPSWPNLIKLSRKSLALALGPVALLSTLGNRIKSAKIQTTLSFFRSVLAAKQLADDSQDWLEDLRSGKITAANVLLLKLAKKDKIILNWERRPEIIYLLFAQIAPLLIKNLKGLCLRARGEAKKLGWPENNKLIKEIILPLEKAAKKAAEFKNLLT